MLFKHKTSVASLCGLKIPLRGAMPPWPPSAASTKMPRLSQSRALQSITIECGAY
jgi:hypothetical protein